MSLESIGKLRALTLGLLSPSSKDLLQQNGLLLADGIVDISQMRLDEPERIEEFVQGFGAELADLPEDLSEKSLEEMSVSFYAVCMIVLRHPEEETVTLVLQNILPILLQLWKAQILGERDLSGAFNWPKMFWTLYMSMMESDAIKFGAEETTRSLMLISRCLTIFLPYAKDTGVIYDQWKLINFDLRRQDGLTFLILDGLESDSQLARKEALRILKSLVAFSTIMADDPASIDPGSFVDEDSSSRIFCWRPEHKKAWIDAWSNFVLLYESLQQPQVHIVSPMLPLLDTFLKRRSLSDPWLGLSWWEVLMAVGFKNDSIGVRRVALEGVLKLGEETFPALHTAQGFIFGQLLRLCDTTAFYYPIDTTRFVSRFGELVVRFYSRFLASIPSKEDFAAMKEQPQFAHRTDALNAYVTSICETVKGPSPSVYLLLALFELAPQPALTEATLEACQRFASSTSTFNNTATRRLVKAQMLRAMVRLGDPTAISYRAASQAVEFFSAEQESFAIGTAEYTELVDWLAASYGTDMCIQSLKNEIERYFSSFDTTAMDENEARARRIAVMASLALSQEGTFGECCAPAYAYMAALSTHVHQPMFVVSALLLFIRLDAAVRRATSNTCDLVERMQVAERVFEWVDVVNSVLLGEAQGTTAQMEYRPAMILIEGQSLLLDAATRLGQDVQLIGLVEMQLFTMLDLLQSFSSRRLAGDSESYGQQLLKIACLELTAVYLRSLNSVGFHQLSFFTHAHLLLVFDCEPSRPPADQMTPTQAGAWSDLQVSFVAAKWRLVSTIAGFFAASPVVDAVETFERCLVALETAKYGAVPAIFGCLTELLGLLPKDDLPYELISESLATGRDLLDSHYDSPRWFDVYATSFLDYALHPLLLAERPHDQALHGPDGVVRDALHYALSELCPRRRGLVNRVAGRLFEAWRHPSGRDSRDAYIDEALQLLLYGPLRDESESHMTQKGDSEEDIAAYAPSHDYLARVHMLCLLDTLDPLSSQDGAYADHLLRLLLDRAQGIGLEEWEAKRAFPNAIQHRRRLRGWQAALLLQPMLRDEQQFRELESGLWQCVAAEALPSTRSYIEWFLVRCYLAFPKAALDGLLPRLTEWERPAAQSISVMAVAHQVGLHLDTASLLTSEFLSETLACLVPSSGEQNAQTRITAQWAFRRLWAHCEANAALSPVIDNAPRALKLIVDSLDRPSSSLNRVKAKQDASATLAGYDPIGDFSLESLLHAYPRAIGMASDELIPPHSFKAVFEAAGIALDNHLLCPVYQAVPKAALGATSLTAPSLLRAEPAAPEDASTEGPELFKDYQRKLAVWDLSLLEEDLATFRRNRQLEKRRQLLGETIVCASLVDKIPNLAGLSRSCEILGATSLIIPDPAVKEDPQFRAISMTSDKWLQIDAVPPVALIAWLEARRKNGFRILAVEQTAASVPLQSYTFPERFVLVLGNESAGIPPEVLHVVDDCIEIPQNGMIRSLNVHVCGSMVLWESRRQLYVRNPAAVAISAVPEGSPVSSTAPTVSPMPL